MNRLTFLLDDHEVFHSEFQIRNLIVARAGGTMYGAYKQAIRELWNRLSGIRAELAKFDLMESPSIQVREKKNNSTQHQLLMTFIETTPTLKDTLRETAILYQLAAWLRSQLGELNHKSKQRLEEELWMYRVKCSIAVDFLSISHLSASTVELLHALPIELRRSILEMLDCPQSHKLLIDWYLNDSLDLPTFDTQNQLAISSELIENICESAKWFGLRRKHRPENLLSPQM